MKQGAWLTMRPLFWCRPGDCARNLGLLCISALRNPFTIS
ncbi:protein of unknown function [Cupriavidus taiwanensis]|nr:protein of unknown function [Cupriavidus taiwanensis]